MKLASILATTVVAILSAIAPVQAAPEEKAYADLGRWRVVVVADGKRFHYCAADTDNGQVQLRLATDGRSWQVGVPYYDNGPVRGQWGFDGWEDEAMFRTDGDGWAVMDASKHILDSFRQFGNFSIEVDRGPQHFDLKGSSAAMKKAVECARNKGRKASASASAGAGAGGVDWVKGRPDKVDRRAVAIGTMPDGMPVFACVANVKGGRHPGMTGMWIEGCSTGYGGREVTSKDFSVMIGKGRWVRASNGQVPDGAMAAGNEADGTPLFVCRAKHQGGMYAGKTRPGFNGCNIPDFGQERTVRAFDVLVW